MARPTKNVQRLREVMDTYNLSRREIAEFLGWPEVTIDSYLCPHGKPLHRKMPDQRRKLLDFEVAQRAGELEAIRARKPGGNMPAASPA